MRTAKTQNIIVAMLVSLASAIPIHSVMAQALEEIVVTARHRTEKLGDVPASITAFTKDVIENAGIERAEDFIAITPGVSMVNAADVGDTSLSIRGLNGARDAETNFAFIIDGILYTNTSAFNREYTALSQIEVLKGPQGALYGRSAAAGAIIVTTDKPSDDPEGSIELSYGEDNTILTKLSVGGALKESQLYGRISLDYRKTDGHLKNNLTNRRSVNSFENYNIAGRLVWEPNESASVDGKLLYGRVNGRAIAFNAGFALPPFADAFMNPAFFEDVNDHVFVFSPNAPTTNEQSTLEASIKLDYDFNALTLTAWMLYTDVKNYFIADGTSGAFGFYFDQQSCIDSTAERQGFPVQAPAFIGATTAQSDTLFPPYSPTTCDGYQLQRRDQKDFSFEVRLASDNESALRWNVGLYFLDIKRYWGDGTYLDDGTNSFPLTFVNESTDNLNYDRFDTTVYSAFGAVSYDLSPDVEASFALRWDLEKRSVRNLVPKPSEQTTTRINYCANLGPERNKGCTLDGAPLLGSPLNPAYVSDLATGVVVDEIPSRSENFSEIQPKLSLSWDAKENLTLFGSWGVGFKSGGFNNTGASATIQNFLVNPGEALDSELVAPSDLFRKETSNAFELGFKAQLADNRVGLTGAVFYTEINDMQFFEFFVGPFGLLRVVENIDKVSLTGFELGATAQLSDALNLNAGLSVVNGKIKENAIRPNTVGNEIPSSPDMTFNFSAHYVKPITEKLNFVGHFIYSLVGKTWFHTVQDDVVPATLFGAPGADFSRSRRDAYGTINLRLGLEGEKWRVTTFANNLTNQKFLAEVIQAPEFGGSFIHPGTERVIGIEFNYKFF